MEIDGSIHYKFFIRLFLAVKLIIRTIKIKKLKKEKTYEIYIT